MATYPRHKKAKLIRDYMIESNTVKMFKEEEKDDCIFFRTLYPMSGDKKQVVLTINDTVYVGLQILLTQQVPVEKVDKVLTMLNAFNLELPTVKYVLTKDQCIVVSMFFPADEKHFHAPMIMGATIQVLKNVAEKHYGIIKEIMEK